MMVMLGEMTMSRERYAKASQLQKCIKDKRYFVYAHRSADTSDLKGAHGVLVLSSSTKRVDASF